ncbi:hypothetical protein DEU56DRAFT_905912 [Suillus clintonianus]|uniref:uncharacterized protein n=1 Tax=Suillus clintonianus TaxID=1904413 RepID=UPI001B884975|nr:uncharacterized protein DEU56DRAFT_905912 [Suillus clintonianus]KAG2157249.1 hypothetical protein DEU56DRAFT_905912 [Suillus clintonianus]
MSTKFPTPSHPSSNSMVLVLDDPSWWPVINAWRFSSYFGVAAFVGVVPYVRTRGRTGLEATLVPDDRPLSECALSRNGFCHPEHTGHWSDDFVDRFSESSAQMPAIPIRLTVTPCTRDVSRIMYSAWNWTNVVAFPMLGVIMITRLHAMYQRSRRILIFLVVVSLAVNIFDFATAVMVTRHVSGEEHILSGTYACMTGYADNIFLLNAITWILGTVWEVLALCLAVWIAVKHFREQRQHSAGGIIGDCFTVLIKSHVLYFASYVTVSCLALVHNLSPKLHLFSFDNQTFTGFVRISQAIQSFVLGPRLILSVREYHARLVADSDAATGMISIAFQERVHISTGSGV